MIGAVFVTFISCQPSPDLEGMKSEILSLHEAEIAAHWARDVDFFSKDISDDYFAVSYGELRHPTPEDIKKQFSTYLNNTTFTEYRDTAEPIIGIAEDGSLAWSIFQIEVAGTRTMDDGIERELDFDCVWITIFEREGDTWIRRGDVSTFR
jgi:hypothetical protein